MRCAESLLSKEKKRQTTHMYGFALLGKERLTSCAESRYTQQGLISTRQGAMSAEECADEHADERASSNSPDVLEAIKKLPPELLEKIYKEFVKIKQKERVALGWNRVHEEMVIMRKVWEREALGWGQGREDLVELGPPRSLHFWLGWGPAPPLFSRCGFFPLLTTFTITITFFCQWWCWW